MRPLLSPATKLLKGISSTSDYGRARVAACGDCDTTRARVRASGFARLVRACATGGRSALYIADGDARCIRERTRMRYTANACQNFPCGAPRPDIFPRARARAPTCAAPLERRVRVTCIKGAKREMVILTSRKTDDTGERRGRDELAADEREDDRKTRSSGSHISFRRRANYYRIVHSSLLAPALVSGDSCTSRLHVNGTCRSVVGLARNLAPVFPRIDSRDHAEIRRLLSRFVFLSRRAWHVRFSFRRCRTWHSSRNAR